MNILSHLLGIDPPSAQSRFAVWHRVAARALVPALLLAGCTRATVSPSPARRVKSELHVQQLTGASGYRLVWAERAGAMGADLVDDSDSVVGTFSRTIANGRIEARVDQNGSTARFLIDHDCFAVLADGEELDVDRSASSGELRLTIAAGGEGRAVKLAMTRDGDVLADARAQAEQSAHVKRLLQSPALTTLMAVMRDQQFASLSGAVAGAAGQTDELSNGGDLPPLPPPPSPSAPTTDVSRLLAPIPDATLVSPAPLDPLYTVAFNNNAGPPLDVLCNSYIQAMITGIGLGILDGLACAGCLGAGAAAVAEAGVNVAVDIGSIAICVVCAAALGISLATLLSCIIKWVISKN